MLPKSTILYLEWCKILLLLLLLLITMLTVLVQIVACLPLVQWDWGSIPVEVINFHLKIFNLGAMRGGDVHFLIARLYITGLD